MIDLKRRRREEIANAVSHGVGIALGVAALAILVTFASLRGDAWRVTGLSIYGTTLVLLYLASTLYHASGTPRVKRMLRSLDHGAIYLLIAGTYTPVTLSFMRDAWGWTLFGLVWGLALVGIAVKATGVRSAGVLSTAIYVAMGWLVLVAVRPVLRDVPVGLLAWLLAGGLAYTSGIAFYAAKRMRYHHAVWHVFVLLGSACHFFGLLLHATAV